MQLPRESYRLSPVRSGLKRLGKVSARKIIYIIRFSAYLSHLATNEDTTSRICLDNVNLLRYVYYTEAPFPFGLHTRSLTFSSYRHMIGTLTVPPVVNKR